MAVFSREALVQRFNRWRKIQAIANELYSLSDRELDDLGISRSRIGEIARASVH